jgi:RHS repeat-associated protein
MCNSRFRSIVTFLTKIFTNGQLQVAVIIKYYFGGAYVTDSDGAGKKYYSFAGKTIAMRNKTGIKYFLTDHLGSIAAVIDDTGTLISQQRYLPFGQVRIDNGSTPQTDFGYTGQRELEEGMGGIMDYKARFYSPYINRFLQPDSIIPDLSNPQSLNRYSYVMSNPLRYSDPTGHWEVETDDPVKEQLKNARKHAAERVKNKKTRVIEAIMEAIATTLISTAPLLKFIA